MRRRTVFLLLAISLLVLGGIGTGVVLLAFHQPGFYRRCAIPPGPERERLSRECVGRLASLAFNIKDGPGEEWAMSITEAEFNSFFEEDFRRNWVDAKTLERQGITAPRLVFDDDYLRLGFHYGKKPWDTIISLEMRVWLAPSDVNVVVVEFVGRHAGSLPISARVLLDRLAEQARSKNIEVTWYRHNGNPVALVRFQSDKARPTFRLSRLAVEKGRIMIGGVSLDPGPQARAPE